MNGYREGRARLEANPRRAALVATSIEVAFADRTWSAATLDGARCFRAFFLRRGRGAFFGADGARLELAAPQILWLPFAARSEFRLFAGGEGASLAATEDVVWRTIGENALAAELRPLLDRMLLAPAERLAPCLGEIEALFLALSRESRDPGAGAPAMTALYLGLLLMHLWRACGLARGSDTHGSGAPTAQRFRQLVELHYRDNLGLEDFSRMLGVTRAHLHKACVRAHGRAPQQLVHERLNVEARLRLRETALTIEQVAYSLGFRDPAYFSRFFTRRSGMSPGAYRKATRLAPSQETTSFAAWP
jgi:AraC family transcriptional regulator, transcriptional activator of pobA